MRDNRNGFTLIELVIVIAVTGLLSTVGIASFVSFNKTQELNAAANDVVTMLNLAKSRAQSQAKPSGCSNIAPVDPLLGYRVVICSQAPLGSECLPQDYNSNDPDASKIFAIYAWCGSSPGNKDLEGKNTKKLPKNISFSSPPPPASYTFLFEVSTGKVIGNGNITLQGENGSKTITVSEDGRISTQ